MCPIIRNILYYSRRYGHGEHEAEPAADVEAEDGDAAARREEQDEHYGDGGELQNWKKEKCVRLVSIHYYWYTQYAL